MPFSIVLTSLITLLINIISGYMPLRISGNFFLLVLLLLYLSFTPIPIPTDSLIQGQGQAQRLSYEYWSGKFWEWNLSNSEIEGSDPCAPTNHESTRFLYGKPDGITTCTIEKDDYVFFPLICAMCIYDPEIKKGIGSKADAIKYCEQGIADMLYLNLDGTKYYTADLRKHELMSEHFIKGNPAFIHGYFVMLQPLSEGEHYLHFKASDAHGFKVDTTYHLVVE